MKVTKASLVEVIYKKHDDLTKKQAEEAVEAFLRLAKENLIEGNDLLLSGFGKFNVRDKKPRRGRNPQTEAEMILDSRRVITFKPAGKLRKKVNGK